MMKRIELDALPAHLRDKIQIRGQCWIWTGAVNKGGYGHFTSQRRTYDAHRFIYGLLKGKPPDCLHHRCEVKRCVNPDHLETVTRKEHAAKHAKRICTRCGQPLKENRNGKWTCKPCYNAWMREWRVKNQEHFRESERKRYYGKRREHHII